MTVKSRKVEEGDVGGRTYQLPVLEYVFLNPMICCTSVYDAHAQSNAILYAELQKHH
jgi:hypothetical protein